MSGSRCAATTQRGEPCGMAPVGGSPYCFAHDPASAVKRDDARRRGGQAGRVAVLPASDLPVRSLADVVALVELTVNDVRADRVDVRVANAVGVLANVAIRAIERSDLERRLEALEAVLEPGRRRTASLRRGA